MIAGVSPAPYHTPVLVQETLDLLLTTSNGIIVDGTLGGGGHAREILSRLGPQGRLIGIDQDEDAIAQASQALAAFGPRATILRGNFSDCAVLVRNAGVTAVDGLLLDLGVSSHQIDAGERGFSFRSDDRLDMRMDRRATLTAADVVNGYPEQELIRILREYGEEHNARSIVQMIIRRRPIGTTGQLAQLIEERIHGPHAVKTLARVFQALRIEVNGELERLRQCLASAPSILAPGGRLAVISYHSLEDRIVKEFMRDKAADREAVTSKYLPDRPRVPELRLVTRRAVTASPEEESLNPRARSARLRVAERM